MNYLDGYESNEVVRSDTLFNEVPKLTVQKAILATCTEDIACTIKASDQLHRYSDVDSDTLSVISLTSSVGSLTDNGNSIWTLSSPKNFNGNIDLSYSVTDGNSGSIDAKQSFSLAAVDDTNIVTNTDGCVDNWSTYRLTDGKTSIQLRNKKEKTYSDSTTKKWDASKAMQSGLSMESSP